MEDTPNFPIHPEKVAAALFELLDHQGSNALAKIVRSAEPSITIDEHDSLDGGRWYCSLHLAVPTSIFADCEENLEKIERTLADKVRKLFRNAGSYFITQVMIGAVPSATSLSSKAPSSTEQNKIWEPNLLRLFLSHVSAHKVTIGKLKVVLRSFGLAGFVAHEDIEPNSEWQREIESALSSMDALCALLTPEFHESKWTDQEIGIALGRSIPVISVRLGLDPYGFIGKHQGIRGDLKAPSSLASSIVEVLLRESRTHEKMRNALVGALENAPNFATSKQIATLLATVRGFSSDQKKRLVTACEVNSQVGGSWGVPEIIRTLTS